MENADSQNGSAGISAATQTDREPFDEGKTVDQLIQTCETLLFVFNGTPEEMADLRGYWNPADISRNDALHQQIENFTAIRNAVGLARARRRYAIH